MAVMEPQGSYYLKQQVWNESRRFLKLTRIQEYEGWYEDIRETFKDDWDREDENLLADVLSDMNFFSAEKRIPASSRGEFSGGCHTRMEMENDKPDGARITLIPSDRERAIPSRYIRSASDYFTLTDATGEENYPVSAAPCGEVMPTCNLRARSAMDEPQEPQEIYWHKCSRRIRSGTENGREDKSDASSSKAKKTKKWKKIAKRGKWVAVKVSDVAIKFAFIVLEGLRTASCPVI